MKADIAVIIVNYGTAELASAAVDSVLARQHGGRRVEIHLVDNGSPGDDAAQLTANHAARGWGDRVTLHLETANHGFGRGNNVVLDKLALRDDAPDYVFLLNPDARLDNEAADIMASFLDTHPETGVVGASILRPDGSPVTAAFRFPGMASEFAGSAAFGPVSRLFSGAQVAFPADLARQEVDWVTGAAFMARFALLKQIGFFDPDFFLYFEETELLWRVRRSGHGIWYLPEARVVHVAGAATGMQAGKHKSKAQPGYWYDSWRLYHVKTRGPGAARGIAVARVAGALVNAAVQWLPGRKSDRPLNFFGDFGRHVLKPLFLGDPHMARPDGKTIKQRSKAA